jgi:DNA-directed RNA polymerase specialized sigma24 family protein
LLVAMEGMKPAEAAMVCGVTPEAMRQRISRGRALLARQLDDETHPLLVALRTVTT